MEKKDTTHEGKAKLTVWLDESELAALDRYLASAGYISRAEWVRSRVRQAIRGLEA